jgi:hypothetical protein
MRRKRIIASVFLLMFGTLAFFRMIGNPRVEILHGADVLGLIASGLCLGFGLALLFRGFMFGGE